MHADSLISAIESHLSSLEGYVTSAILIAVVTYWSGLFQKGPIEIVGLTVNRRYAAFVTGVAFLFLNIATLLSLVRIDALLAAVPGDRFAEAVTKLGTNSWLLNPFSFFGTGRLARVVSAWGFGGLIVAWWLCNTSFSLLQERVSRGAPERRFGLIAIAALFLLIGLLTMQAINLAYFIVVSRGEGTLPTELHRSILDSAMERHVCTMVGIGVGGAIFSLSNLAKRRLVKEQKSAEGDTVDDDLTSSATFNLSAPPIVMRGLPLHLSGWNGEFRLTTETRNGRGVWARRAHWYKGFVPLRIIGVAMWFNGKTWVLKRDCDSADVIMVRARHAHDTPVGKWEGKATVIPATDKASAADEAGRSTDEAATG